MEYVRECVNRTGGREGAMYQCACAIDRIAEKLTYDEFVEASTYAKYSTLPGEGGGIFRDTDEAKQKAKLFRTVEGEAYQRACEACRIDLQRLTAMPHGDLPTGIFLITFSVAVSTTLTSFDGPFAV